MGDSARLVRRPLEYLHFLSLDAVFVILLWTCAVNESVAGYSPRPYQLLILGLAVWIGYTVDRLLDGVRMDSHRIASECHRFHHRHRWSIAVTLLLMLAVMFTVINRFTDERERFYGVLLTVLVIVYLFVVQKLRTRHFHKEVWVGFLLACGVCLIPIAQLGLTTTICWYFGSLWGLFVLNCRAVALVEHNLDRNQAVASWIKSPVQDRANLLRGAMLYSMLIIGLMGVNLIALQFGALLVSVTLLLTAYLHGFGRQLCERREVRDSKLAVRSAILDLTLIIPPLSLWLLQDIA